MRRCPEYLPLNDAQLANQMEMAQYEITLNYFESSCSKQTLSDSLCKELLCYLLEIVFRMSFSIQMRESQFKQCFHNDIWNDFSRFSPCTLAYKRTSTFWLQFQHNFMQRSVPIHARKVAVKTMIRNQRRMSMSSCNTKTNVFSFVYYNIYLLRVSQPTLTWGPHTCGAPGNCPACI